jgi:anti-anti-sigma factor
MDDARAFFGRADETLVLRLFGPIRFRSVRELRRFVDDVVAHDGGGDDGVSLDLRGVDMIDSTGLGLLARVGRLSLEQRGRRAVIVCPDNDVATSLRSAAFDQLFLMLDEYPYRDSAPFTEIALEPPDGGSAGEPELGRMILDAHRDLAAISERNLEVYRDVIAALEADLGGKTPPGTD